MSWSLKNMILPVATPLAKRPGEVKSDKQCYMTDEEWLASVWEPIIAGIKNRDDHANPQIAAKGAIPVWNSYSIFRCFMEMAVFANGKTKRGSPGKFVTKRKRGHPQLVWVKR